MSTLTHDAGDDFFVPLALNKKPARYLLDTGAWVSVMTAGEAKRLGLEVRAASGTIGDSSGRGARVRKTVVKDLSVGAMQFRDVSFMVLDSEEPLGILGMPLILAIGHFQWKSQGVWVLGGPSDRTPVASNMVFYKNKLLLASSVFGARVFGTLDTGAITTDLNSNFAKQFASSIEGRATRTTQTIEGIGGTSSFDGVTVPEVAFQIGHSSIVLSPARVTFQLNAGIGGECCVGNIGLDLLTRTGKLDFDFSTMVLKVE
jgi:clan AA aspartic protease (TIGR02281 family)